MYFTPIGTFLILIVNIIAERKDVPAKDPSGTSLLMPVLKKAAISYSAKLFMTCEVAVSYESNILLRVPHMSLAIEAFFYKLDINKLRILGS